MCSFRLGLLGFAASAALREDNAAAGDEGVGNYGMCIPSTELRCATHEAGF